MKLGTTGTQHGATDAQMLAAAELLGRLQPDEGHHGGCIGWDAEFHQLCLAGGVKAFVYPASGVNFSKRAVCSGAEVTYEPKPPLDRNTTIVDASDVMLACPGEFDEVLRSGTWATIRRARKAGRPLYIVFPDGSIKEENVTM